MAAVRAAEGLADPDTLSLAAIASTPGASRAGFAWYRIAAAAYNLCHAERWRLLRGMGRAYYRQSAADAILSDVNLPAVRAAWDRMLPALEAFEGPVAFVVGDCDYLDPGAAMMGRLRDATFRAVPDAGHVAWIDAPDETMAALDAALRHAAGRP